MSARHKLLGPLAAVAVALGVLAGVVLPAGPASAAPQCQWQVEPTPDCPEPMPPVRPTVPPPMGNDPNMPMESLPGAPTPRPGEACSQFEARDGIFIRESGRPAKRVYTLIVTINWCYTDIDLDDQNEGIVTRATVTSRTVRDVPGDNRLVELSATRNAFRQSLGGDVFTDVEEVFFRGCGDPFNAASCRNYRHSVQLRVTANGGLSGFGRLELFNGPLPVII